MNWGPTSLIILGKQAQLLRNELTEDGGNSLRLQEARHLHFLGGGEFQSYLVLGHRFGM
jgi:hypothetical protein